MAVEFRVERVGRLTPGDLSEHFVRPRRAVVIRGGLKSCAAPARWNFEHLRERSGDQLVLLKSWGGSGICVEQARLRDYIDDIRNYEISGAGESARPAYLHDVPLTSIIPDAALDLDGAPDYFPSWYGASWPKFAQLFLGPSGSVTPLHFDCLLTHNLFFQIVGEKRFTLLPFEQAKNCYRRNWRWFDVDVEHPNYERHPLYQAATPVSVTVGPGDILYLPPGTMHHVRSLDCALSFNVDWHTRDSALYGVAAALRGMPWKNVYYNAIIALGLWSGVPPKTLLPYYSSYLNYVS
jgi:hypothetical protein